MKFGKALIGCEVNVTHGSHATGCRVRVLAYHKSEGSGRMLYDVFNIDKDKRQTLLASSVEDSLSGGGNVRVPLSDSGGVEDVVG